MQQLRRAGVQGRCTFGHANEEVQVSSHILHAHCYRRVAWVSDSGRASGDVRVVGDLVWSFPFTGIPAK